MTPPDDDFNPKRVDEQIDRLSTDPNLSDHQETGSTRLVRRLRALYPLATPAQRQRSLERAWERISRAEAFATSAAETPPATTAETLAAARRGPGDTASINQPQPQKEPMWLMPRNNRGVSMTRKKIQGITAFVTVAAVVGLFALLLHTFLPAHLPSKVASSGTPQASPTATTPPTPAGQWASVPGLTNINGSLMIAPSNPQVVYEDLTPAGTTDFSLRRSDNGGKTWHTLARPAGLPGAYDETSIVVSPLDPMTIFLTLTIYAGSHPDQCALTSTSDALVSTRPDSGGPSCGVQFYSTNGGAQWSRVHLPIPGAFGAPSVNLPDPTSAEVLRPQGQRLYSAVGASTVDNITFLGSGARIVASDDGGKTWKLVDADIQASGQHTCDFMPTPTGSTIFAITQAGDCYNSQNPSTSFFWRSDDGGAQWAQVSQLSDTASSIVFVNRSAGADPLIYIHTPVYTTSSQANAQVMVSQDGGKTWQAAPTAGLPAPTFSNSGLFSSYGPFAALSDGSVVNIFPTQNNTLTFAVWKLGEKAWLPVAPNLAGSVNPGSFFVTPDANGKVTFWLITGYPNGESVLRYDQQ